MVRLLPLNSDGFVRSQDWVIVRSKEEILSTLDGEARLGGMPFMPEMLEFCGRRLRVDKVAHKTCDTINPTASRTVQNSVHLQGARCSGFAHGDCQAACNLFWREEWLRPIGDEAEGDRTSANSNPIPQCLEKDLDRATLAPDSSPKSLKFRCQATELLAFTTPLGRFDVLQYVADYRSGNVGIGQMASTAFYFLCVFFGRPLRRVWNDGFVWAYDRFQDVWGGIPFPRRLGSLELGDPGPRADLNLQPGELVRVKPYAEILETIDKDFMNRGMRFDAELVPYCGGTFQVRSRVERFIDERTGRMRRMKTPVVILDNVWCRSRFSQWRLFCPRAIYSWWRECWLTRVSPSETEGVPLGARYVLNTKSVGTSARNE